MSLGNRFLAMEPRSRETHLARCHAIEAVTAAQLTLKPQSAEGEGGAAPLPYEVLDGVAVISVSGSIFQEHGLLEDFYAWLYGGTFTSDVAAFARSAKMDPNVTSAIMRINSGGGDALGLSGASAALAELAEAKPLVSVVEGVAGSAAYYLASPASEIVTSNDGILGSIGTIMAWLNYDKMLAEKGIEEVVVKSKQSPKKWPDEMTAEGRAEYQSQVDALGDLFVGDVAKNRGVAKSVVLSDYGQGGVLIGKAAVKAGLADRIGTFEGVLAQLQSGSYKPPAKGHKTKAAAKPPAKSQEKSMSFKEKFLALFAEDDDIEPGSEREGKTADSNGITVKVNADTSELEAKLKASEDRIAAITADAERINREAIATKVSTACASLVSSGVYTPAAMEPATEGEPAPLESFAAALAAKDPALLDSFVAFSATLPKHDATKQVETVGEAGGVKVVQANADGKVDLKDAVRGRVRQMNKATRVAGKENN